MNSSFWPFSVHQVSDFLGQARERAYLPKALWLQLRKEYPKLRVKSLVLIETADASYWAHPFPCMNLNSDTVEIYGCPRISNTATITDSRVIRVLTSPIPVATKIFVKCTGEYEEDTLKRVLLSKIISAGSQLVFEKVFVVVISIEGTASILDPMRTDASTQIEFVKETRNNNITDVGMEMVAYEQLKELIYACRRVSSEGLLDVPIISGILLSGPPGVGKTHTVRRICDNMQVPVILVNGPELFSPFLGETEAALTCQFRAAEEAAQESAWHCALLFIDEIDSIAGKRDTTGQQQEQRQNENRMLGHLLMLMDGVRGRRGVIVVGATNRPNAIDPALRRPGRFDREILINPPTELQRLQILDNLLKGFPMAATVEELAHRTVGFVAADLSALGRELILAGVTLKDSIIDRREVERALALVRPSLTREYRVNVDFNLTWDDLGGMSAVKERLQQCIEWPLKHAESFRRMGLSPSKGVLLHGPPGCSKTTIAKVLAATGAFSFYSLSGATILSTFVGEAERILREVFAAARLTAPSLIFIDEIDSLVCKRGDSGAASGDVVQERILSTLLNEMDGVDCGGQRVLVLGATNRPKAIDEALLRPGRFDQIVEIGLPTLEDRVDILKVLVRKMPISKTVDFDRIAEMCEGYSGASLKQLLQEAALKAIHEDKNEITENDLYSILNSKCKV